MGFEIELKAECSNAGEIKKLLAPFNPRYGGIEKQADLYFIHPSRDFMTTDEALRIRRVNGRNILTYKGPRLKGAAKTRIENEVEISDFNAMKTILENLGFTMSMEVKKEREIYILGEIALCIDNVEGLGLYIEFEKISDDRAETERELLDFAGKIGINKFEKRSYLEILIDKAGGL